MPSYIEDRQGWLDTSRPEDHEGSRSLDGGPILSKVLSTPLDANDPPDVCVLSSEEERLHDGEREIVAALRERRQKVACTIRTHLTFNHRQDHEDIVVPLTSAGQAEERSPPPSKGLHAAPLNICDPG